MQFILRLGKTEYQEQRHLDQKDEDYRDHIAEILHFQRKQKPGVIKYGEYHHQILESLADLDCAGSPFFQDIDHAPD